MRKGKQGEERKRERKKVRNKERNKEKRLHIGNRALKSPNLVVRSTWKK